MGLVGILSIYLRAYFFFRGVQFPNSCSKVLRFSGIFFNVKCYYGFLYKIRKTAKH